MACQSCDSVMERVKEKMTHIEQLRKELMSNEENYKTLLLKYETNEKEKAWIEKQSGFLSRQTQYLRGENDRLMKLLCEKHVQCLENERLLDVIHKDRDECIEEKMKVSKFYRMEIKKLSEDNMELRKDNSFLRKRNEDQILQSAIDISKDEGVPKDTQDILSKLVDTLSEDRKQLADFHVEFEKTRQQMEGLMESMARLEMSVNRKPAQPVAPSPIYRPAEDKESGCSCDEQHRTLEQLIACPDLDRRIREELDQSSKEESEEEKEEVEFEIVEE